MDRPLSVGVWDLDGLELTCGESWCAVPARGKLRLQAAHHDRPELVGVRSHRSSEALAVEELEQRGEALDVPVVWGRGEEEPVLAVGGKGADRLCPERVGGVVATAAGRSHAVRLVHDEDVEPTRIGGLSLGREHLAEQAERALALEEVDGRDESREVVPRVHVETALAPELLQQLGIDDAEVQPELVPHLIAPLDLERGRADHEDPARPVTHNQLLDHEPGLDGLAQTHVVGDQEVGARHLDGAHDRVELVVLDLDAAAERGLERAHVGRRSSSPTDSV
jgi:hypothetical protein